MPSALSHIDILQATKEDIPALYGLYDQLGKRDVGYFEALFEKECVVLIAVTNPVIPTEVGISNKPDSGLRQNDSDLIMVGFGVLNFEPKYSLYQRLNIPEIQDLNVITDMRQKGIATAMIDMFEQIAADQGAEHIGICVGVHSKFGPAQRLYTKLGYIPDGNGVTYDRQPIDAARAYPVDDDLCLMMVKNL